MTAAKNSLLVQIAINGDYWENYGAHDWNGKGKCPQFWKSKGTNQIPMICNVAIEDIPSVVADITGSMDAMSWSNEGSSCSFYGVTVYPNRLSVSEMVEFDYKCYNEITSISQEDLMVFLKAFGMEPEQMPAPLPYEEYEEF